MDLQHPQGESVNPIQNTAAASSARPRSHKTTTAVN
jgi:hypothetical protein